MSKIGIASASNAALIDLFSFRRNVHYFKIFYSNKPGAIHHVDMVGFNIKCATTRDVIQAKIASGELKSLNDQFGAIRYRFT